MISDQQISHPFLTSLVKISALQPTPLKLLAFQKILCFLQLEDIFKLATVCRVLRRFIYSPATYKSLMMGRCRVMQKAGVVKGREVDGAVEVGLSFSQADFKQQIDSLQRSKTFLLDNLKLEGQKINRMLQQQSSYRRSLGLQQSIIARKAGQLVFLKKLCQISEGRLAAVKEQLHEKLRGFENRKSALLMETQEAEVRKGRLKDRQQLIAFRVKQLIEMQEKAPEYEGQAKEGLRLISEMLQK